MEPPALVLHASNPLLRAVRTLDLDACCATARPADGGATVAVGTYTLREGGTRDGILYFFHTAGAEDVLVVRCVLTLTDAQRRGFNQPTSADRGRVWAHLCLFLCARRRRLGACTRLASSMRAGAPRLTSSPWRVQTAP